MGQLLRPTNFPKPLLPLNRQQLSLSRILRLMLGLKIMSYEDSWKLKSAQSMKVRLLIRMLWAFLFVAFVYCVSKASYTNQVRRHKWKWKEKPLGGKKKSVRNCCVSWKGEGIEELFHPSPSLVNTWCGNGIFLSRGHILWLYIILVIEFED